QLARWHGVVFLRPCEAEHILPCASLAENPICLNETKVHRKRLVETCWVLLSCGSHLLREVYASTALFRKQAKTIVRFLQALPSVQIFALVQPEVFLVAAYVR